MNDCHDCPDKIDSPQVLPQIKHFYIPEISHCHDHNKTIKSMKIRMIKNFSTPNLSKYLVEEHYQKSIDDGNFPVGKIFSSSDDFKIIL